MEGSRFGRGRYRTVRRVAAYVLTTFLVVSATSPAGTASEAAGAAEVIKNAILISWDGVQREHLRELIDAGRLPNLQAVIAEGGIVEIDVTHKTDTKAGHAQLLTGYGPEVTGVYSNSVYRPIPEGYTIFERLEDEFGDDGIATIMITGKGGNLGSRGPDQEPARKSARKSARQPAAAGEPTRDSVREVRELAQMSTSTLKPAWSLSDAARPWAQTRAPGTEGKAAWREEVLERLKKVFGDDKVGRAIISAMTRLRPLVLQESLPSLQLAPRLRKVPERVEERYRKALREAVQARLGQGEPYYNARQDIDLFHGDEARSADEVGQLALNSLDQHGAQRFFAFFHFGDPDSAGHKSGENSQDYSDAIVRTDRWLGHIVEKLKQLGIYDETRIYVTSDHGFDEGRTSHSMAPYVFLATNDETIQRRGDQRDIAPTILSRMGVDVSKLQPPLLGRLLNEQERPW